MPKQVTATKPTNHQWCRVDKVLASSIQVFQYFDHSHFSFTTFWSFTDASTLTSVFD